MRRRSMTIVDCSLLSKFYGLKQALSASEASVATTSQRTIAHYRPGITVTKRLGYDVYVRLVTLTPKLCRSKNEQVSRRRLSLIELQARPENIRVELNRSAIVVVDMQNAFAKPGGMLDLHGGDITQAASVIDINASLLPTARAAGVKVIYLAMTYQPDLSDGGGPASPNYHKELALRLMRQRPELSGKLLIDGTWDWQIVDELKPHPEDLLIRKPRYSGFVGTDLDNILRHEDIQFLFFTGIATNVCVESTARDAFFGEYWPILIEDAISHTGPDFCRDATLWNCENIFGWVSNAASVAATFNGSNR